jgi:hypothetical protein
MVVSAADLDCLEAVIAGDASDIGPEFGLEFLAQAFLPFFGAEDHVNTQARIRMRHGSSLRDLISNLAAYPALKRWAMLVRPPDLFVSVPDRPLTRES